MVSSTLKYIITFMIFQMLIISSYETSTEHIKEIKKKEKKNTKDGLDELKKDKVNKENEMNIEKLEKEKGEMFKKINAAIDESIKLLNKTNDTEALLGAKLMAELKDQIKEINGTDLQIADDDFIERRTFNNTDARKANKKKIKLSLEEIASIFKKKDVKNKVEMAENQIEVQKRIDAWILQKQLEKKKIHEYKEKLKKQSMAGALEKCPRVGIGKKSIKVNGIKKKIYYPCCRKCCKKSYMGCL